MPDPADLENVRPLLKGEIHLWSVPGVASEDKAVLSLLLAAYLGVKPADVKLASQKKGKLFVLNDPSLFFNLSNSDNLSVYAFSRDNEVGVDIEKIRELPDIDQLIDKNLTTGEKSYLLKNPEQKLSLFFKFWTCKESYLKAIGEGMRLTPENLEFSFEKESIRLHSVKYGFEADSWHFQVYFPEGKYTCTLCYKGKDTTIRELNFNPLSDYRPGLL